MRPRARARRRHAAPARRARADAVRCAPRRAYGGRARSASSPAGCGSRRSCSGSRSTAKLYPLLLLPLFAIRRAPAGGPAGAAAVVPGSPPGRSRSSCVPFLALAPGEAWFSIRAQLTRGLQVESLPGSVVLALGRVADELGLGALGTGVAEGGTGDVRSADVTGTLGSVVGTLAGLGGGRRGRRDLGRPRGGARRSPRGSSGTARPSSRPRSRWDGCCRRSSSSGCCRSSRSSRGAAGGSRARSSPSRSS